MAELMHFNIPGAFNEGFDRGTTQRKTSRLAELASQAYGAAPGQRDQFVQQAIANDPTTGLALGSSLRSDQDARTKELVNRARMLVSAPEAQRAAIYQGMIPDLQRMGMQQMPPQYDDTVAQTAQAIVQAYGFADGATPAGLREFQAMTQGLSAEDQMKARRVALGLEGRASSAGVGFGTFKDAQGFERPQRNNPRSGQVEIWYDEQGRWVPLGQAQGGAPSGLPQTGAPPMQTMFTGADGTPVNLNLGPDVPPSVAADIMRNEAAWAAAPEMSTANLPEQRVAQFSGTPAGLGRGRRPEDEAAAVESAKQGVQLGFLPQELGARTDAAVDQAVRIEEGKTNLERAAAAPAAIATVQQSLDSIDALLSDPNLDSILGVGSMNPLNMIPGSPAKGLIARAEQIAGQSFLAAFNQLKGGGAITEREGEAATKAMARLDRAQSPKDYRAALGDLKDALTPALARAQAAAAGGAQGAAAPGRRLKFNPATGRLE